MAQPPIEPRPVNRANMPDMLISGTLKSIEQSDMLANKQLSDISQSTGETAKTLKQLAPTLGQARDFIESFISATRGDKGDKGDTGPKGDSAFTPEEAVNLIAPLIPPPIPGQPGRDGRDAPQMGEIIREVLPYIPIPKDGIDGAKGSDGSPDSGSDIVEKINDLGEDSPKIDASHIGGLPRAVTQITKVIGSGGLHDVIVTNPTDGQTLVYSGALRKWINGAGGGGGGSGQVNTVVAGSGITVDSTSAANPIISITPVTPPTTVSVGDTTTNGSWRMIVVGNDLSIQRREAGVWNEKGIFQAT